LGVPDFGEIDLGVPLNGLRQLVEYIGDLMHPAALMPRAWKHLIQCFPETKRAVARRQFRRDCQPTRLQIDEQFPPTLCALTIADHHITFHFYEPLQWVRNNALIYALIPLKTAFQQVPWVALVALVAAAGWYLGGIRLALVCSAFVAFIAFSGFWSRSMITAYMVTVAVLICLLIGLPMGIWAAGTDRLRGTALWIACMLGVAFIVLGGILPIEPILWSKSETAQEPETVAMVHKVFFALIAIGAVAAPIFIWWLGGEWRAKAIKFLLDTFQTFPSFIYLLPVIMLFKVGDVAAISAIIIYAMIPVVRYTIFGLQNVPNEIVEAGLTSGCTPRQLLWKVRMPFALPEMMLGLNQTIMFALFMVIIAGFIGTTDLGQEIFRALTFNDAGKGLVVGMCVAFMGLTVDQLITAWAAKRKKALGMS